MAQLSAWQDYTSHKLYIQQISVPLTVRNNVRVLPGKTGVVSLTLQQNKHHSLLDILSPYSNTSLSTMSAPLFTEDRCSSISDDDVEVCDVEVTLVNR